MSQTFKSLIANYQGKLKIAEQTFSDEIISTKMLDTCAFIKLIFFNGSFHKVNFSGSSFASCEFHNCNFSKVILKRVEFESCHFRNCKISDSNLSKVDFDDTSFHSYQFKRIALPAGYLINCKIIESDFEEIDSAYACAIIVDSQITKFNQSIDLHGGFNFNKLVEFLKSIPGSLSYKGIQNNNEE